MMHSMKILSARLHNARNVAVTYSKPINLPMPMRAMSPDYVWPRYTSTHDIRDQAMRLFGVSFEDFTGGGRDTWIVAARQYFCYHARMFASQENGRHASLSHIIGLTGRTDHSTAIYAANRHALAWKLPRHWSLEGGMAKTVHNETLREYREKFGQFKKMQALSRGCSTYYSDMLSMSTCSHAALDQLGLRVGPGPKKILDSAGISRKSMKALGL